jgi:uncharacterized membrane protein
MCDMEGIVLLGIFIIFVLVIVMLSMISLLKDKLEQLDGSLTRQLKAVQNEIKKLNAPSSDDAPAQTPALLKDLQAKAAAMAAVKAEAEASTLPVAPAAVVAPVPQPQHLPPPVPPAVPQQVPAPAPLAQKIPTPVKPLQSVGSQQETAMERIFQKIWDWIVVAEEYRRPEVPAEFAIATAWLVRFGIIIVVMAVGFGLQLSISSGLLGPTGRVALALLCGSAFVALGLRNMTKKLALLGQGFIGGGFAMFYFAFFAASMMYKLMPIGVAFGCMIGVTAAAVVIAVRFNALSIAALGAIGGYLTPVMIRTSTGNIPGLSAYLLPQHLHLHGGDA